MDETMEEEDEEEMAVDLNFETDTGEEDEKDGNNKKYGSNDIRSLLHRQKSEDELDGDQGVNERKQDDRQS